METITINKDQLTSALMQWEVDARMGKTQAIEESRAQAAREVAENAVAYLWEALKQRAIT